MGANGNTTAMPYLVRFIQRFYQDISRSFETVTKNLISSRRFVFVLKRKVSTWGWSGRSKNSAPLCEKLRIVTNTGKLRRAMPTMIETSRIWCLLVKLWRPRCEEN